MKVTLTQIAALLLVREGKLRPTSPLHSEGSEVGGLNNIETIVGWQIDDDQAKKIAKKLAADPIGNEDVRIHTFTETRSGESSEDEDEDSDGTGTRSKYFGVSVRVDGHGLRDAMDTLVKYAGILIPIGEKFRLGEPGFHVDGDYESGMCYDE